MVGMSGFGGSLMVVGSGGGLRIAGRLVGKVGNWEILGYV